MERLKRLRAAQLNKTYQKEVVSTQQRKLQEERDRAARESLQRAAYRRSPSPPSPRCREQLHTHGVPSRSLNVYCPPWKQRCRCRVGVTSAACHVAHAGRRNASVCHHRHGTCSQGGSAHSFMRCSGIEGGAGAGVRTGEAALATTAIRCLLSCLHSACGQVQLLPPIESTGCLTCTSSTAHLCCWGLSQIGMHLLPQEGLAPGPM